MYIPDPATASTDDLVAAFHELRGPFGEAPEGESVEAGRARRSQLAAVHRELKSRRAVPATVSRASGFGQARRRKTSSAFGLR